MLATKDIREELDIIEDVRLSIKDEVDKASLKALCLIVKLLKDIRTNQTLIMKKEGIKLIESQKEVV